MTTTVIAKTNRGHRIWCQGLSSLGYTGRFSVIYTDNAITVVFSDTGKRKLCAAKGGIVDIEGKKVTQWARGASEATLTFHSNMIVINRN